MYTHPIRGWAYIPAVVSPGVALDGYKLSLQRERLARRLNLRAVTGLSLLLLVCCSAFALAVAAAWLGQQTAFAGQWLSALSWTVLGVLTLWFGLRVGGCLLAPNPPPIGVALTRELAPSLHTLVDGIAQRFGNVRVDTIWITGDINAAVLQRPRRGLVGRMETHLLLGLPLTHSVSERQLAAILAHEFGHLACQRRELSAWGCHARAWWFRAIDLCMERFPPFADLLDRATLSDVMRAQSLSRMEEFEADQAAADAVGAPLLAQTLVEVAARERFLRNDYWVKVMAQCADRPRPTVRPYRDMGLGMVAGFLPSADRGDCMDDQCGAEDGLHPSLIERLAALHETPALDALVEDSVAERHLAHMVTRLAWELDRAWWSMTRVEWREAYRSTRRSRRSAA